MNHVQFCLGLFKNLKSPTKAEVIHLIYYLYGDFSITVLSFESNWLIELRDKSRLWIKEEFVHEILASKGVELLFFEEWKGEGLPWEDRGNNKHFYRNPGEGRSDNLH